MVRLAGSLVLRAHVQDAVRVDIEGHFNLRQSARRRRDAFEVELAEELVAFGHLTFTLIDLDRHGRLIVFSRREDLLMLRRDRGVALDHRGHHAAQGLNAEGKRGHVEQQHVAGVAGKHRTLNRSTDSHSLIRVHVLTRFLTEELLHHFLDTRHTGLTADQNHVGNVRRLQAGILQSLAAGFDGTLHEVLNEALELGAGQRHIQMLRTRGVSRDVRNVDFRFLTAGEFDLRGFSGILQTLQGEGVLREVDARILLELADQVVHHTAVKVRAAEERIAVRGQHFKLLVAVNVREFNDRNIERAAAKVIHGDLTVTLAALVKAKGQSRSGRFVDDALHFKTSDTASILRCLTLAVVEVGRNRNHGFRHRLAEIILSGLLHLAEHFSGNLLRGKLAVTLHLHPGVTVIGLNNLVRQMSHGGLNSRIVIATANQTLHLKNRVLRVRHGLALRGHAHDHFAAVHIRHDGRRRTSALAVLNHADLVAFHHSHS